MGANDNQPDWDKIAEKFDLWLPHIAPVGEALLAALQARAGERILDVASGTGEPALTLARLQPLAQIIGVDAAPAMVKVAQAKVERAGLDNIAFRVMPAERLEFPDYHFDAILCRFGVMLFEDSLQGATEMCRVLKSGGRFALAVWSTPETMTTMYWACQVFRDRVPADDQPPIAKVTSLGQPGVLDELLDRAGFSDFQIEPRRFDYKFESFEAYWSVIEASDIMRQQFEALAPGQRDEVRDEVARFARDFHGDDGLVIPHEFLLATGVK